MDTIFWLIDRLPTPILLHREGKIIHANAAFKNFLTEECSSNFDFLQWLTKIIKSKKDYESFASAFKDNQEITLNAESSVKGTIKYWLIFSFPLAKNFSEEKIQITLFQDNSSAKITKSYWDLSLRVNKATMQLIKEIAERKKAEAKAAALTGQLVTTARRAGMADIAASVLHNIGNVLNSINVSVSLIDEKISESKMSRLNDLANLFTQHENDLDTFISKDPKGQAIPKYLSKLAAIWENDKKTLLEEIKQLEKNVEHVKTIVDMQQSLSDALGIKENVNIADLLEDALTLNKIACENASIEIIKEYASLPPILVDRTKLLQILVNLIRNAIEALQESNNKPKRLTISSKAEKESKILIQIADNGIGISPENKNKIFSHGFTTKKQGHGFGLHTSALAAKEMNGSLTAMSEGPGNGATFKLLLPSK